MTRKEADDAGCTPHSIVHRHLREANEGKKFQSRSIDGAEPGRAGTVQQGVQVRGLCKVHHESESVSSLSLIACFTVTIHYLWAWSRRSSTAATVNDGTVLPREQRDCDLRRLIAERGTPQGAMSSVGADRGRCCNGRRRMRHGGVLEDAPEALGAHGCRRRRHSFGWGKWGCFI